MNIKKIISFVLLSIILLILVGSAISQSGAFQHLSVLETLWFPDFYINKDSTLLMKSYKIESDTGTITHNYTYSSNKTFMFQIDVSNGTSSTGNIYLYNYLRFPSLFQGSRLVIDSVSVMVQNNDVSDAGIDSLRYRCKKARTDGYCLERNIYCNAFTDTCTFDYQFKKFTMVVDDTVPTEYYGGYNVTSNRTLLYAYIHQSASYKIYIYSYYIYGHYVK